MIYLILCLISIIFGAFGAWAISRWGPVLGVLDRANHRSSHDGVVPKGGGIGILAAFLLSAWVLEFPVLFWGSIGLVSLLSFYGDRREIPAKVRLCLQLMAGIGLLAGLFYWQGRAWPTYLLIPLLSVFIAGTANYYNFMDGINGIAGITGIVGFGLIVLFSALSSGDSAFLPLAACMALACLGFLPFNLPNARVFMGDVGSVLLGFVFAALAVALSRSVNDFIVLCSFLFPFYADELTTACARLRDGENLLKPHRRHIYQLLANELAIPHWKVSVGYGVLQVAVGLAAMGIKGYGTGALSLFLGVCFAAFWAFGLLVRNAASR